MLKRTTQLRLRRAMRRQQQQVEAVADAAEKQLDRNVIGRFDRFWRVKRFAFGWLVLVLLAIGCIILQTVALSGYYQHVKPVPGGIYNEGIVGTYSNANPLYATGPVDTAVSRLVFAGLLRYDDHNQLAGDLATGYTVDSTGKQYVVHLRQGLTWQDGQPLTAKDVVYTFQMAQNPDAGSPLLPSWQNIGITALNPYTVRFTLPNAFSAFPYNLTTGLLPKHLLANVPATQLRSISFDTTQPIGAGPFAWQAIQTAGPLDTTQALSLIGLKPFAHYADGAPQLHGFIIHTYGNTDEMVTAFKHRDINAMAGLNSVPAGLAQQKDTVVTNFPSTAAVMTFFKTTNGVLADKTVRQALEQATNTAAILDHLGYPTKPVREPLLVGQLGYNSTYAQAPYNPTTAKNLLTSNGWQPASNGTMVKNGQSLAFRLYAEDTPENRVTTQELVHDWSAIGAVVTPVLQPTTDFQATLAFHTYDALLYGISIGVDPDVFPYWDSSQADVRSNTRLNFSEYKSATADAALEAGRTRLDPALRALKYKAFLQAWQSDVPAVGLYQPRFLYISRGTVYGLPEHPLNTDADRYYSVQNWEILTAKVTNK